jgi:hypothetical protein
MPQGRLCGIEASDGDEVTGFGKGRGGTTEMRCDTIHEIVFVFRGMNETADMIVC